jgi:hypothetical protein
MGCVERERYLTTLGKIFFYFVFVEGWDVGRDEEERGVLIFLFEGVVLPQADMLMGWVCPVLLEEISYFFIPSPLCHAFLQGNNSIIYVV